MSIVKHETFRHSMIFVNVSRETFALLVYIIAYTLSVHSIDELCRMQGCKRGYFSNVSIIFSQWYLTCRGREE